MAKRRNYKRDRNGRFASTTGGGSTATTGRALPRRSKQTTARQKTFGPGGRVAVYMQNNGYGLEEAGPGRPLTKAQKTKGVQVAARTEAVISGVVVAQSARQSYVYGLGASGAAVAGQIPLAAALGAKSATQGAIALNEAHRIRTVTSKKYVNGTVSDRSKFNTSYQKRSRVLNRADTASELVAIAATGLTLGGPLIAQRAAARRAQRANSDARGVPGQPIGRTEPKAARRRRNGVYDITTAKGKRVA